MNLHGGSIRVGYKVGLVDYSIQWWGNVVERPCTGTCLLTKQWGCNGWGSDLGSIVSVLQVEDQSLTTVQSILVVSMSPEIADAIEQCGGWGW